MDERMPLTSEPKTRAEYRAAIRAMQEEIHRLFAEMDQNQTEWDRRWARVEQIEARTDANLRALEVRMERLRSSQVADKALAEKQQEAAEKDWQIFQLQSENALLRFEHRLLPR